MPPVIRTQYVRHSVTLELAGEQPYVLPSFGDQRVTLKPGDNEIPIAYFHALGLHQPTADRIIDGTITPVCRSHVFIPEEDNRERDADGCRSCGVNRGMVPRRPTHKGGA